MNWVDLVVLAILVLSGLIGLMRGGAREVLGLCAWVGAAVLATRLYPQGLPLSRRLIGDDAVADPVAFLVVFVVLLIAFLLVAAALGSLVRGSLLGSLDRLAGGVFGLLRGFLVLVIAFLVVVPLLPTAEWPQSVRDCRSLGYVRQGAVFVAARLPDRFRPDLGSPPTDGPAGSSGEDHAT